MKICHESTWCTMVYHGISLYYMELHGKPLHEFTSHGKLWYIILYLFQNTMVFYHGFDPCFKTPWYFTTASIPVSKHHGILPWLSLLSWFTMDLPCFKTSWYTMAFTMVQNILAFTMVYFHKGRPESDRT